jgi:hypothetical protein
MAALSTHGETTHDLLNNLFKAYAKAECEEFRNLVKDARRDWECNCHLYEPEILMNECHDEYSHLLRLSRWGAHTEWEEHIITLLAKIEYLKASHTKMPKTPKIPGKQTVKFSRKWKWKMDPPSKCEPLKKEVNGKQYHWCPGHKFWTKHSLTNCTLLHP